MAGQNNFMQSFPNQAQAPTQMPPQMAYYQNNQQFPGMLTQREREIKLSKIIYNHPEMLNQQERETSQWKQSFFYAASGYAFLTPLYSAYMFRVIRKQPQYHKAGVRRIFFMPLLSLVWLTYSASALQKHTNILIAKYLNGITDHEIHNFEQMYQQVRQAQQMQMQQFHQNQFAHYPGIQPPKLQ
jgi:hypothetical protein